MTRTEGTCSFHIFFIYTCQVFECRTSLGPECCWFWIFFSVKHSPTAFTLHLRSVKNYSQQQSLAHKSGGASMRQTVQQATKIIEALVHHWEAHRKGHHTLWELDFSKCSSRSILGHPPKPPQNLSHQHMSMYAQGSRESRKFPAGKQIQQHHLLNMLGESVSHYFWQPLPLPQSHKFSCVTIAIAVEHIQKVIFISPWSTVWQELHWVSSMLHVQLVSTAALH